MEILESVRASEQTERSIRRLTKAIHAPAWAEYLICFGLGLVLSAAPIAGSPAPFGIAMLAVLGFDTGVFLFFVGAAVGYYAGFGFIAGTQMIGGCMLVLLLSHFLRGNKIIRSRAYSILCATTAYGVTRAALYWMTGGISATLLIRVGFFLLLCASSAYLYHDAIELREPRTVNAEICRSVSIVYVLATLLIGLSRFVLFHTVSVGRVVAVMTLLVLSHTGGALCGAASGVVMGVSMDVAASNLALLSVVYPISASCSFNILY